MNSKRRYCSFCNKKRSVNSLVQIYYKLLNKSAYHCKEHVSAVQDLLEIIQPNKKGTFLELFSGSKEISNVASEYYKSICNVDIKETFLPSICKDIVNVKLSELPQDIDFIWASIPCTTYSIMSIATHWHKINHSWRKYYFYPKSQEAKEAVKILERTMWIIRNVKPRVFIIENPRGALRHMPQITAIPFRHTVSYNDYGFDYYKPTDLFTNFPGLKLHKIKTSVNQSFTGSIRNITSKYERSKVPPLLIHSILNQTTLLNL